MLKQLSEVEFERRTVGGARTPVFKEFIADRETPVSVLTRVAGVTVSFSLASLLSGITGSADCCGLSVLEKTAV